MTTIRCLVGTQRLPKDLQTGQTQVDLVRKPLRAPLGERHGFSSGTGTTSGASLHQGGFAMLPFLPASAEDSRGQLAVN